MSRESIKSDSVEQKDESWIKRKLWGNDLKDLEKSEGLLVEGLELVEPSPFRKALTILQLNYSILVADTPQFQSFKAIVKYFLIVALLGVTFGFSPVTFPNGFAKLDLDKICRNTRTDVTASKNLVRKLAAIDQAQIQVDKAREVVSKIRFFVENASFNNKAQDIPVTNGDTVIRAPSSTNQIYPSFPNGCTQNQADRALRAAVNQKCEQKVCVDDFALNIICKTIKVPCEPSDLMSKAIEWQKYRDLQQKQIEAAGNVTVEEKSPVAVSPEQSRLMQDTLNRLSYKFHISMTMYNIYRVIGLAFATPVAILTPPLWTGISSVLTSISQPAFIIGVVLFWEISYYLTLPEIQALLEKIKANPCYFDVESAKERFKLVPETCNQVNDLKKQFNNIKYEFDNIEAEAQAYGTCFSAMWKSNNVLTDYPAKQKYDPTNFLGAQEITFDQARQVVSNKFVGKCFPIEGVALLDNDVKVPLPSGPILGFLAAILIPTVVFHILLNFIAFLHPQVMHSGRYISLPGKLISSDRVPILESMVIRHLRRTHLLPLIFWILLGVVVLILTLTQK
jgi:hypothetical protein